MLTEDKAATLDEIFDYLDTYFPTAKVALTACLDDNCAEKAKFHARAYIKRGKKETVLAVAMLRSGPVPTKIEVEKEEEITSSGDTRSATLRELINLLHKG